MKYLIYIAGLAIVLFALYKWRTPRFIAGETAPDFQATLPDGSAARLSDLKGKYVLLQFWGSWCGPCRKENRHLAQLYTQYHDAGLEFFSIGIEASAQDWQKAITADGLQWKRHSMEAQDFSGPLARLYNIRSIPATFLLNPDGVIIGVKLREEQLDKLLREKLGQPGG